MRLLLTRGLALFYYQLTTNNNNKGFVMDLKELRKKKGLSQIEVAV